MPARDLFISHSSDDAEEARALRGILEAAGYSCWMAPDDMVGTEAWTEQILEAIADSKAMIVLVSTGANQSRHVSREVNLALSKGRPVLPIRIEGVPPGGSLEYLLSLVQRLDAFPPPISNHHDRIVRRVKTIFDRTQGEAPASTATTDTTTTSALIAASPPTPAQTPSSDANPSGSGVNVLGNKMFIPGKDGKPDVVIAWPPQMTKGSEPPVREAGSGRGRLQFIGGVLVALVVAGFLGARLLPGGASPSPMPSAAAAASAGVTLAPTQPPGTSPPTAAPLSAQEQLLVDRLPLVSAGTAGCAPWPTPPGGTDVLSPSGYAGSVARVRCEGPSVGGPSAEYVLYASRATLKADFDGIMTSQGVARGGACATAIPANAPWSFPDSFDSGDLACFERNGQVQYVWTQFELRILAQWLAPDNVAGINFWQAWTTTMNRDELDLLAVLPASVDDVFRCNRAPDRYYESALAILACPRTAPEAAVYYALFPQATAGDDPLTETFDSILADVGFAETTSEGCYESKFGRYTWGYLNNGEVGDTEGYLGCYERTDTTPKTAQFIWTFDRDSVMGLWTAPDIDTGVDFFDDWIGEVR